MKILSETSDPFEQPPPSILQNLELIMYCWKYMLETTLLL